MGEASVFVIAAETWACLCVFVSVYGMLGVVTPAITTPTAGQSLL